METFKRGVTIDQMQIVQVTQVEPKLARFIPTGKLRIFMKPHDRPASEVPATAAALIARARQKHALQVPLDPFVLASTTRHERRHDRRAVSEETAKAIGHSAQAETSMPAETVMPDTFHPTPTPTPEMTPTLWSNSDLRMFGESPLVNDNHGFCEDPQDAPNPLSGPNDIA